MKQTILYGGLRALDSELKNVADARYTILLDENTFQHCLPLLISEVEPLQEAEFIEVPAGEECKSLEVAAQVWQTLLEGEADRKHIIVNLGGGSVCDLGGFVAAGYKRGIRYINVPTTLLAMVDAAIGGKTAIDFGGIKNSIGHFYPAEMTVIDRSFLESLPQVELTCGLMEMVKTAAVTDPALYDRLLSADRLSSALINGVVRIKARVVKADPYDNGIRKILNFGHTFGHAIEAYTAMLPADNGRFLPIPHGIAVGIGMRYAMYLSTKKVGLSEEVYRSYTQWLGIQLSASGFQVPVFNLKEIEQMLRLMHQDKKNAEGCLRCVLLQELGAPVIDANIDDNEVRDAMLQRY